MRGARGGLRRRRRARHPRLPQARARLSRAATRLRPRRRRARDRRHAGGRARRGRSRRRAHPLRHADVWRPSREARGADARRHRPLHRVHPLEDRPRHRRGHVLATAQLGWWLLSLAIMVGSVWPMAWRWQRLLAARGVHDSLRAARPHVLRRLRSRPGAADVARRRRVAHLRDRAPARGLRRRRGRDGAARARARRRRRRSCSRRSGSRSRSAATTSAAISGSSSPSSSARSCSASLLFSTRLHPLLQRTRPLLRVAAHRPAAARRLLSRCTRSAATLPLLVGMFALTLVVQAVRVLAIWAAGKAVGVDLSPRPYYVMGPLLFLVMLVPFTVNGLAVRESFFVSFLGALGVGADRAFATGFLFFVVTIALAVPGVAIVLREGAAPQMSDVSVVVVTYNAMPWLEQCLESVRGVRDGRRRPRLDRRHARARPRALPGGRARRAGEPRPRLRLEHRRRADGGPLRPPAQLRRLARRGRARGARRVRRRPPGRRRRRPAAPLSRTGGSSAPYAAFRRSGGSRRSFSSCASSRPARRRSTRSTRAASTTTRCARPRC